VVSDMAPNLSGVRATDQARSIHLCELALEFARVRLSRRREALVVFERRIRSSGGDARSHRYPNPRDLTERHSAKPERIRAPVRTNECCGPDRLPRTPLRLGAMSRNHKVELPSAQSVLEAFEHRFFPKIPANDRNSGIGAISRRSTAMTRPDRPTRSARACDQLPGAAPRSTTESPGRASPFPLEEFEQLKGRARSIPLRFRPVNVGIIHVALEPRLAGFASGIPS